MTSALVIGSGNCVMQDAAMAMSIMDFDAFAAVNDMIAKWPYHLDYAVTLHPDRLDGWMRAREAAGHPGEPITWSHVSRGPRGRVHRPPDRQTRGDWGGSSGLLAVKIMLVEERMDRVVLAGVPLDAKYKHLGQEKDWRAAQSFRRGWRNHLHEFRDKTRSMSGWTMELLGRPEPGWIPERIAGERPVAQEPRTGAGE